MKGVDTMEIFVFGSNLAGRHGKGGALTARRYYGAIYGQAVGLQGRSYAIPTKDKHFRPLQLCIIEIYIQQFLEFAKAHPEHKFKLTPVGTGLAGYSIEQLESILPENLPDNVIPLWNRKD